MLSVSIKAIYNIMLGFTERLKTVSTTVYIDSFQNCYKLPN